MELSNIFRLTIENFYIQLQYIKRLYEQYVEYIKKEENLLVETHKWKHTPTHKHPDSHNTPHTFVQSS